MNAPIKPLLGSVALMMLIATCGMLLAAASQKNAYSYAFAHSDCAPWDGPAIRLVLQTVEPKLIPGKLSPQDGAVGSPLPQASYPQYSIFLWLEKTGNALPLNQWIPLDHEKGAASWCAGYSQCQMAEGRIHFTRVTPKLIQGEFQQVSLNRVRQERAIPFKAPLLPYSPLCG